MELWRRREDGGIRDAHRPSSTGISSLFPDALSQRGRGGGGILRVRVGGRHWHDRVACVVRWGQRTMAIWVHGLQPQWSTRGRRRSACSTIRWRSQTESRSSSGSRALACARLRLPLLPDASLPTVSARVTLSSCGTMTAGGRRQ